MFLTKVQKQLTEEKHLQQNGIGIIKRGYARKKGRKKELDPYLIPQT